MSGASHSQVLWAIPVLIAVGLLALPAHAKYSGGTGEPNDPYRIATAADLIALSEDPNDYDEHFILTADIDLSAYDGRDGRPAFHGIAPDTDLDKLYYQGIAFTGVFDGGGHKLSHLTITGNSYLALFGELASTAVIRNLGIEDANVTGSGDFIAPLAAESRGAITRCYSTGVVNGTGKAQERAYNIAGLIASNFGDVTSCHSTAAVTGGTYVGGFAGSNWGIVTGCYSTGSVRGGGSIGGLIGENLSIVDRCYAVGTVTGETCVGGLVGENYQGYVTNCWSSGAVGGNWHVGGLIGQNGDYTEAGKLAAMSQCYSTGEVKGQSNVGGLVGTNLAAVASSFWDSQASGQTTSAGGTGKTTAEMQMIQTFLEAGWDFVGETGNGTEDIWWINKGKDYPKLSWQGVAGIVFVSIPADTFEMGDHDGVAGGGATPVHAVTLDGFQMSKYETTNAQYAEYLNAAMADGLIQVVNGMVYASSDANLAKPYCDTCDSSPYSQIEYGRGRFGVRGRDGKPMSSHPMARLTWYGAKAFCDYYGCRLPTEAEWEYAAHGGYHDPYYLFPWGTNSIDCSMANCKINGNFCNPLGLTSWPYTTPVGYYGPQGAYGLCDMSGNLWEWCQDWHDAAYYSVSPARNPTGPATGTYRVLRGGAWDVEGRSCEVVGRCVGDPLVRGHVTGFRVCR